MNNAKYLGQRRSDGARNELLYSQEEGLGGGQSPSTIDELCRRNSRASDAQRHNLTSEQTKSESLRPDTGEPSPKGLEKHRRRVVPDLWSRNLRRVQGSSSGIDFIVELGRDWGNGLLPRRRNGGNALVHGNSWWMFRSEGRLSCGEN